MKKTLMIAILAMLVMSVACGSNDDNGKSLLVNPAEKTVKATETATPKLTPEQVASQNRDANIKSMKARVSELRAESGWRDEVIKPGPCESNNRMLTAESVLNEMRSLKVEAADIGITEADLQQITVDAAKVWLSFMKDSANGNPDPRVANCAIGEAMPCDNASEACNEIIQTLTRLDLEPKDIGLTNAGLRAMCQKAIAAEISLWRKQVGHPEENSESTLRIQNGFQRFGFSPKELGLTTEEFQALSD